MNNFNQPFFNNNPYLRQELIKVSSIDSARAYPLPPNSMQALFNDHEDILYIKQTDGAGYPTIRTFTLTEVNEKKAPDVDLSQFVTRADFATAINALKAELAGGNNA